MLTQILHEVSSVALSKRLHQTTFLIHHSKCYPFQLSFAFVLSSIQVLTRPDPDELPRSDYIGHVQSGMAVEGFILSLHGCKVKHIAHQFLPLLFFIIFLYISFCLKFNMSNPSLFPSLRTNLISMVSSNTFYNSFPMMLKGVFLYKYEMLH